MLAITFSIPIWLVILLVCGIGYVICSFKIKMNNQPSGTFADGLSFLPHFINLLIWTIRLIFKLKKILNHDKYNKTTSLFALERNEASSSRSSYDAG